MPRMHTPEHPPVDTPESAARWVPFAEARQILGVSEGTLRRMIRDGKVVAEAEPREPVSSRIRYRIRIDPPGDAPAAADSEAGETPGQPPEAATAPLEAYVALVADVRALERENGALRARLEAAEQAAARLTDELAAERARVNEMTSRLARPWWERLLGR